jgi:hypothetical protein
MMVFLCVTFDIAKLGSDEIRADVIGSELVRTFPSNGPFEPCLH